MHMTRNKQTIELATAHAKRPPYFFRPLPSGAFMKPTEGAASSWAGLRLATFLMLADRRLFLVENRARMLGQAKDELA